MFLETLHGCLQVGGNSHFLQTLWTGFGGKDLHLWVYVRALAGRDVVALWGLSSGIVSVELCQLKPALMKTEEVFSGLGCGYLWH